MRPKQDAMSMLWKGVIDMQVADKIFHPERIASSFCQYKTLYNGIDPPLVVGMEVEVHLCDHNPVEKNVNRDSDEEGAMASTTKLHKI